MPESLLKQRDVRHRASTGQSALNRRQCAIQLDLEVIPGGSHLQCAVRLVVTDRNVNSQVRGQRLEPDGYVVGSRGGQQLERFWRGRLSTANSNLPNSTPLVTRLPQSGL